MSACTIIEIELSFQARAAHQFAKLARVATRLHALIRHVELLHEPLDLLEMLELLAARRDSATASERSSGYAKINAMAVDAAFFSQFAWSTSSVGRSATRRFDPGPAASRT